MTKKCPTCAEIIKLEAKKCHFCGKGMDLDDAIPGIGPTTSATLICNLPELGFLSQKKIAMLAVNEIDFFLFTQLNLNTIKDVMQRLNQPLEKTHWIMDKWGYTGASCIPMALDDALVEGKGPRPGDLVLFCASGGGFAIACAVFKW